MLSEWERRPVTIHDSKGEMLGLVTYQGTIYNASNRKVGQITQSGEILDANGKLIAQASRSGIMDTNGKKLGSSQLKHS
jgi:hypothetical protein